MASDSITDDVQNKSMKNVNAMTTNIKVRQELMKHIGYGLVVPDNMTVLPYFMRYDDKPMYKIHMQYDDYTAYYIAYVSNTKFVYHGLYYYSNNHNGYIYMISYEVKGIGSKLTQLQNLSLVNLINMFHFADSHDCQSRHYLVKAVIEKNFVIDSILKISYVNDEFYGGVFVSEGKHFYIDDDGTRKPLQEARPGYFISPYNGYEPKPEPESEKVEKLDTYGIEVPTGDELREESLKWFIKDFVRRVKDCTASGYVSFKKDTPSYCTDWIEAYAKENGCRFTDNNNNKCMYW